MNLHFLIPNLFWPDSKFHEIYQELSLPAIETLFAKSSRTKFDSEGVEDWLCKAFSVRRQHDIPVAPLTLLADKTFDIEAGEKYWLRADPVHLRVEHDQVLLADSRTFHISLEEASQFVEVINKYFSQDNLTSQNGDNKKELISIFPLCADRWYLCLQKPPLIHTHLLSDVIVKNINDYFPYGPEEMFWRGLLNEVQMLLHEHPLNQIREERGDLALNGIWFWGGGISPEPVISPYEYVWSNDVFLSSLAIASGINLMELPNNMEAWPHLNKSDRQLIFLNSLYGKAQYGDAHGWRESLKELEKNWFMPMLTMLRQGIIKQVTITAINEGVTRNFFITRNNLYRFWRLGRPFPTYID
ncbi:MAG: phosphoglycerate mutase [Nitrosomonadaceae bacterium]|nr:phosphoglycerate mutase [Nitrosomonadaceae bacterium]|tara:strand:- start:75 stop:1145 length:1071 start_codon:yes stop_codon:yes gene_type:complete